jgi:YHS domain-containing protein
MTSQTSFEWIDCADDGLPDPGTPVRTACGGLVKYSASTPCVKFRGQRVFFCLPVCKADFENDPMNSCMAVHIQDNV